MYRIEKDIKLIYSDMLAQLRPANVAMFHVGRVGSTVLGKMLDQHTKMYWEGEFYLPHSFRNLQHHTGEQDAITLLRLRMSAAGLKIFGFETKCHRAQDFQRIKRSMEDYLQELMGLGFTHFILLERMNLLRCFVSMVVGQARGEWHNEREPELMRVNLDLSGISVRGEEKPLFEWFEEFNQVYDRLRMLLSGHKVLELRYEEDILRDPTDAYRSICAFLDVEPTRTEIELRKSNPFPLPDILENYEEVADAFRGTRHEWMLVEERFSYL